MKRLLLVSSMLALLASCGPPVDREGTLTRLRAAIDEDVAEATVLEDHNQLVETVRDGNVLDGMRRSEVEAALGRGQECGASDLCARQGFRETDWLYEVGRRDDLPWGPTIVIGFDRQGIVDHVYTLTRR